MNVFVGLSSRTAEALPGQAIHHMDGRGRRLETREHFVVDFAMGRMGASVIV